jgi:hypothetical protein
LQMAMSKEARITTKMFPATPLASMLAFRDLPFHQRAAPSQSQRGFALLLTGFRFSPMLFRHTPSPQ